MFESYIGQQISIFNRINYRFICRRVGCLSLSVFTNWWQGTLNEALAKHFIIGPKVKVLVLGHSKRKTLHSLKSLSIFIL